MGWVINPSNPYQLAKVVKKFFGLSESERKKISEFSRNRIKSKFSLAKLTEKYDDLYKKFLL